MTQNMIICNFNYPLLNSMGNEMYDRPNDFVEQLVNKLNELLSLDSNYTQHNFKTFQEKYDILYSNIIKELNNVNSTSVKVLQKHILLLNILESHEGTKNLFEVETIGKIRRKVSNNQDLELTLQEAIFLKKVILESKAKTIYKQQLLEQLKDISI